ncbi:MAG: hypothetical protein WAK17_18690 [Candidatus Nitrosopolaris sp.]
MLLANGITTIRNPGGSTEQSVALKENIAIGKIKGPRIFTAGRLINTVCRKASHDRTRS